MRKFLFIACVMVILSPPHGAGGQERKAESIDELAKLYDVSSCKQCHPREYEQWEKSMHSHSIIGTGRTIDAFSRMIKNYLLGDQWKYAGVRSVSDIKVEHLMPCLECHIPQIKDAGDGVARQLAQAAIDGDMSVLGKLSVNCIVCHRDKAIIDQWVDGAPGKNVLYGTKDSPHKDVKAFPEVKRGPIMGEAIFCGQCHGLGPNFHYPNVVQCASAYGSYLHNYVPAGGSKTCQECHVTASGHEMTAYRDPAFAATAVRVEVEAQTYYFHPKPFEWTPEAVLTVKMTSNAGHRIPDG